MRTCLVLLRGFVISVRITGHVRNDARPLMICLCVVTTRDLFLFAVCCKSHVYTLSIIMQRICSLTILQWHPFRRPLCFLGGFFACMLSALYISHFSFISSDGQDLPQAFLWVVTRPCGLYGAVSKRVCCRCRGVAVHAVRVDQLVSVQRDVRDGHEIQRALH